MTHMRSSEIATTFRHPFVLAALEMTQPAGTYRLVIEEEQILGLSFLAWRRTATLLHLPALSVRGGKRQVVAIDPVEWAALVEADERD